MHAGLGGVDAGKAVGKRVLVTGAAGAVGMWVVQLARVAGAEVVGVCKGENGELVEELGAGKVIDYRVTDLKVWGREERNQVDVVIDCSGRKVLEDSWWVLKDRGLLVSIYQPPEGVRPVELKGKKVENSFFIMRSDGAELEEISRLVEEGRCRPVVDSVWRIEGYEKAFERADGGCAVGKVVIDLMSQSQ